MVYDCMLSTNDNPYNPFEQFTSWLMFDKEKGYNSCERLARVANVSEDMSQKEIDDEMERAIDIIIKNDFLNIFIKVKKESTEIVDEDTTETGE